MIYSDFRVLKPNKDGVYGLPANPEFESEMNQYLVEMKQAVTNDTSDAEIKLLKDLNYLQSHTKHVESILSKYDVMSKFNPQGQGKLVVIDSYTQKQE